jgi:hypothetical protein
MKRNTLIIAALVVVLGVFAIVLLTKNSTGTIKPELKDFAVQDTASIDKIFMVKKSNEQVTLTREEDGWMVNGRYEVRSDAIDLLLKTIHRLKVKAPVSKSALDYVLKMMATRNTKVEIYSKGKLVKTYYVGGPTQDQIGTFMMLEGSSVPFVVSIPGFVGYLSTRYFTNEFEWRTPMLLKYDFNEIARIESVNNDNPEQSFLLLNGNNTLSMSRLKDNYQAPVMDTLAVRFFVSNFERVACEFFADLLPPETLDSLEMATPFHVLKVTDIYGKTTTIEAHRREPGEQADPEAPVPEYDLERMYAKINDNNWVVIQYFVFNPLFREYDFFLPQQ